MREIQKATAAGILLVAVLLAGCGEQPAGSAKTTAVNSTQSTRADSVPSSAASAMPLANAAKRFAFPVKKARFPGVHRKKGFTAFGRKEVHRP